MSDRLLVASPDQIADSAFPFRMLTKGTSARIHVQLRGAASGANRRSVMPLETFAANKSMGRVLFRRGGQTIAAGIVLEVFP